MASRLPRSGSCSMKFALALLSLIGFAQAAAAADFLVNETANDAAISGTFPWAINEVGSAGEETNLITFTTAVNGQILSVTEGAPLPAIALGASGHSVEINAESTNGFEINGPTEPENTFNILDIQTGKATLVDLKISGGEFNIQTDGILEFKDTSAYPDREITDVIKGAGRLIKAGEQTLTLSGENSYTGGTQITGGILKGDRKGLGATNGLFQFIADAEQEDRGTLTFEDSEAEVWTWDGSTDGDGKVTKAGTSTLQLGGAASFAHTGGTELLNGSLEAQSVKLVGSDIAISQDALLKFTENAVDSNFDSAITGAGRVEKSGTNTLTLNGTNTFSGGLTIAEGAITGSAASLGEGSIALESGSGVTFNQGSDGTFTGGITGTGTLTKSGTGNLVIESDLGNLIDTSLSAGGLELRGANLASDITAGADTTLTFRPGQAGSTFSGSIINDPIEVLKTGQNALTFSNAQTYTTPTIVSAGALTLGGNLASNSTRVESGARLATATGSGEVSLGGPLTNSGTLTLADSSSVLSVNGLIDLDPGSVLEIAVGGSGNGLLKSTTGDIDIESMAFKLTDIQKGDCDPNCSVTIMSAEVGTISNGNVSDETNLAYWAVDSFNLDGTEKNYVVQISPLTNSAVYAQTNNQRATSPAWDHVRLSGTPDGEGLRAASDGYSPEQVRETLDQVAGEPLASFVNAREANAQRFAQALWQRFRASEYAPGWYQDRPSTSEEEEEEYSRETLPAVSAAASGASSSSPGGDRLSGWAQPFGIFLENDGRGRASDMKSRVYGLSGGVDYALPGSLGLRFGGALGYTRYSIFSESSSLMEGQANTYQGAVYGAWQNRHFHVGIAGRYGYTTMQSQRTITVGAPRVAAARFAGQEGGAMIEIGATLGNPTFFAVRPIAAFQYDRLTQNSFKEQGAGDLSLRVSKQDYTSLLTTLGARISKLYTYEGGFGIEPEIRVGWTYQAGDKARPITATTYNVAGSVPFTTYGAEPDRNAIWVGAGYVMRTTDTVRIGLDYDAYIGEYYTQQVVSAELQIIW